MKIKILMPDTEEGIQLLKMKISEIHALAIINSIEKLPCEADKKLLLLSSIKEEIRKRSKGIAK